MNSKFYVVGTPIGNLEDITLRALRVLKEVDLILCEDTRVTKKLLKHYEIETPLLSYHSHSGVSKSDKIFELVREGKNIALVSDAGTPTISDPGAKLVKEIKDRFKEEVSVEGVPGASAVITALSVSGVYADSFVFLGFPPHKKGRKTFFENIKKYEITIVFYESPHRLIKTLNALSETLGSDVNIVVVRELTKIYEEVVRGSAEKLLDYFTKNTEKVRGEFVVIVDYKNK
jgi:16S rRNA (cytidine1402-2'-O)-methyltransferase